jgi:hypothetical protein
VQAGLPEASESGMTFILGCILALASLLPAQGAIGPPLIAGQANFADPSHGSGYLAMRLPRGTHVRITGAGGSVLMTVNDYGPVEATGDIADIALVRFARICGWTVAEAKRRGECAVEVEVGVRIALPATDTVP